MVAQVEAKRRIAALPKRRHHHRRVLVCSSVSGNGSQEISNVLRSASSGLFSSRWLTAAVAVKGKQWGERLSADSSSLCHLEGSLIVSNVVGQQCNKSKRIVRKSSVVVIGLFENSRKSRSLTCGCCTAVGREARKAKMTLPKFYDRQWARQTLSPEQKNR